MLALRIVEIVFPLFSIAALGLIYARRFKPEMAVTNSLNMNVFVPALIFSVLIEQKPNLTEFQPLFLGCLLIMLGAGLVAWLIAQLFGFQKKTFVPPMMFKNSGNLGLPLITLTFGNAALPVATILLLTENTLHFTLGSLLLGKKGNPLKNLMSPIIVATVCALAINISAIEINSTLMRPIEMMGKVSIPLMIFSLGTRLAQANLHEWKIGFVAAVSGPVCGVLIALLIVPWLALSPMQSGALIMFGALPPAVLNFMFAERYQQQPDKVASIVILSHLFTLASLPLALAYVIPRFT